MSGMTIFWHWVPKSLEGSLRFRMMRVIAVLLGVVLHGECALSETYCVAVASATASSVHLMPALVRGVKGHQTFLTWEDFPYMEAKCIHDKGTLIRTKVLMHEFSCHDKSESHLHLYPWAHAVCGDFSTSPRLVWGRGRGKRGGGGGGISS